MITLWAIPPESWCGYDSARSAGSRMPTLARRSMAACLARSQCTPRCSRRTRAIWFPTRSTGSSRAFAFVAMRPISLPLIFRYSEGFKPTRDLPRNRMSPPRIRPLPGKRPMIARASTDFPEPVSPTIPRISFSPKLKVIDLRTFTHSPSCSKPAVSSCNSRIGFI